MADAVSKEVDLWLGQMSELLKARAVDGDVSLMLERSVEHVLGGIGLAKLQELEAAEVLVRVRDGLPKAPGNYLRPDWIQKNSDQVARIVESYFAKNKIRSGGLHTLGDGVVNELEARIAEYIAKLPGDVKIQRDGLTLVLSKQGAALKVKGEGVEVAAALKGKQNSLGIDTRSLKLRLGNDGKELRFAATLQHVAKDLKLLVELQGRREAVVGDATKSAALEAKCEATLGKVRVRTDASLEEIEAKIDYLGGEGGLKKLAVELKSDYEKVKAKLELAHQKGDTKLLVQATAEASKLEARINLEGVTSGGLNVKGEVKASVERAEAALEAVRKSKGSNLKLVAALESDYEDLKAKADLVYKSSGKVQVELVAKFEATLDRLRATLEASLRAEAWQLTAGGSVDTDGKASGKLEALAKLGDGFQLMGQNAYLKVGADVNAERWNVFVGISLTTPPKAEDVKKLIDSAEGNVNRAYGVLKDPALDGADAARILSEMGRHLKAKPPKVSLEAGFFVGGSIPQASVPSLPLTGGVGLELTWF